MKKWLSLMMIILILFISGCRTLDGNGAAAGAGTYPLKTAPASTDTVLITVVDPTKAGGFDIRRTPMSNIPVSIPVQDAIDDAVENATGSTITPDETDPTKAAAATFADAASAVPGGGITTGTVAEARIDAAIARDSEVTTAISGKFNTPTGTTSQVVLGDGSLGSLPAGSTITADTTTPTKAAVAVLADSATTASHATAADSATTAGSADVATVAGSVSPTKESGVPGYAKLLEANGTETDGVILIGPASKTGTIGLQLPSDNPTSGSTLIIGTGASGTLPNGESGTLYPVTYGTPGASADDTAYDTSWNGDTTTPASKNALYDKIETLSAGAAPTIQSADPTSASSVGFYGATTSGDFFYKASDRLFNISTGTCTLDPTTPTIVSATIPTTGETISLVFSEAMKTGAGGTTGWTLNTPTDAMTYSSGTGTDTLVFTLATTILDADVPTISYTQPTNGWESNDDGTDLVSISGASVTNNSTQIYETTVYVGATTCGAQSCDYGAVTGVTLNPGAPDINTILSTNVLIDGKEGISIIVLDTSNIPAGKTITAVSLWVYTSDSDIDPDGTINIYKMLTAPGGNSSVDLSNVTYNEKDASGNIQWGGNTQANPLSGTDFNAAAIFSASASTFATSQFTEISSTGLLQLVTDWYDGTSPQYGILIKNTENYSHVNIINERSATANTRYYWEITYTD